MARVVSSDKVRREGLLIRGWNYLFGKGFHDTTPSSLWRTNNGWGGGSLRPGQKVNYAAHVGNGLASSVLMAPIKWVQRTLPEAPLAVARCDSDIQEKIEDHPLIYRVTHPNDYHTLSTMWQAVVYSFIVDGNAYWIKKRSNMNGTPWYRNGVGEVEELWWVPHWRIKPVAPDDGSSYITHYELATNEDWVEIPTENVIHFRNGIDPQRPQYGMSMIWSEMREIWTDDEAAKFTSSLLQNVGVPGLVVSPKIWPGNDSDDSVVIPDVDAVKRYLEERFGASNRGRALVMQAPTDVQTLGYSPQQMDLSNLRNTVEERVCAAIGIPASVIGFGTGLQQTKVGATMHEQVQLAWMGCIIPIQDTLAEQLYLSLLPEYEEDPDKFKVYFDRARVKALRADEDAMFERLNKAVQAGWVRVDHAQAQAGFDVDDTQSIYLRPMNIMEVPAEQEKEAGGPPPPFPGMPPGMLPPPAQALAEGSAQGSEKDSDGKDSGKGSAQDSGGKPKSKQ